MFAARGFSKLYVCTGDSVKPIEIFYLKLCLKTLLFSCSLIVHIYTFLPIFLLSSLYTLSTYSSYITLYITPAKYVNWANVSSLEDLSISTRPNILIQIGKLKYFPRSKYLQFGRLKYFHQTEKLEVLLECQASSYPYR